MRALWVAAWSAALILMVAFAGALAASPGKPPEMDQYGGYREIRSPGGGTGFFRVEKIGARWIFVTPEGHAFWLRAVYGVDTYDGGAAYRDVLMRKYSPKNDPNWKPDWFPWGAFVGQTSKRLKAWGFNCIGENSAIYAMHGVRSDTNPEPILPDPAPALTRFRFPNLNAYHLGRLMAVPACALARSLLRRTPKEVRA